MKSCANDHHRFHGRGPGSYGMVDPDRVFAELAPAEGSVFLDLGCGPGDYAVHAAKLVGPQGTVLAVDRSPDMVAELWGKALTNCLGNIRTLALDITQPLPLDPECVDICFLSTVLHALRTPERRGAVLAEAHRVLAPSGELAVVELKKEPTSFGPPLEQRISEEVMADLARGCGFAPACFLDLGPFYLAVFRKT